MGELDTEFLGDERRCDADRLGIDAIQRTDEGATNNRDDLKTGQRSVVDQSGDVHCAR